MDKKLHSYRERLSELEMTPSPHVWEKIAAANPRPVMKPLQKRWIRISIGAAFLGACGLLIWILSPDTSSPDTLPAKQDLASNGSSHSLQNPVLEDQSDLISEDEKRSVDQNKPMVESAHGENPAASEVPVQGSVVAHPISPATSTIYTPVTTTITTIPSAGQITPVAIPAPHNSMQVDKPDGEDVEDRNVGSTETPEKIKLFIPNAFYPNGDGMNDVFLPVAKDNAAVLDYQMQIYSRAGQLLFESNHIEKGWDGSFQNAPFEEPVCIYLITFRDVEGRPYTERGTITILR